MIATTLEQSRKLVELGIDPNSADMHYAFTVIGGSAFSDIIDNSATLLPGKKNTKYPYEPAWSLSALLEQLPESINCDGKPWSNYCLYILKTGVFYAFHDEEGVANVLYGVRLYNKYTGENVGINNLIDACVEMIVKLEEMNLI